MPTADEDAGWGSWEGYEQGHAPAGSGTETSVPAEYNTEPDAAGATTPDNVQPANARVAEIKVMKKKDLDAELKKQSLETKGGLETKQQRLIDHLDATSAAPLPPPPATAAEDGGTSDVPVETEVPAHVRPANARVAEIKAMKKKDLDAELKKLGLATKGGLEVKQQVAMGGKIIFMPPCSVCWIITTEIHRGT